MDEIWQRHKAFILQVAVGGLAFLIALAVMSNAYSGADDPEELKRINRNKKDALEKAVREKRAPSPASIAAQRERAAQAEREIREMAAMCASLAEGDDYVRENIVWTLANIGRPASDAELFVNLYKQFPQTGLTRLREEARAELVKRASQDRMVIEETLGIAGVPADDEVPAALHGLALVTDVIRRALEVNATLDPEGRKKIAAVRDLRVTPRNALDRDLAWISGIEVHVSLVGEPEPVLAVMRTFNSAGDVGGVRNVQKRITVLGRLAGILRDKGGDEESVKSSFNLLGLQHKGVKGAEP
jgi:hypothetical protein